MELCRTNCIQRSVETWLPVGSRCELPPRWNQSLRSGQWRLPTELHFSTAARPQDDACLRASRMRMDGDLTFCLLDGFRGGREGGEGWRYEIHESLCRSRLIVESMRKIRNRVVSEASRFSAHRAPMSEPRRALDGSHSGSALYGAAVSLPNSRLPGRSTWKSSKKFRKPAVIPLTLMIFPSSRCRPADP
jgi:hypothetical protein